MSGQTVQAEERDPREMLRQLVQAVWQAEERDPREMLRRPAQAVWQAEEQALREVLRQPERMRRRRNVPDAAGR